MQTFIANKAAEKDIRDWLSQNGFRGKSAKFTELELHAIQRPGWLQIFRFELQAFTADSLQVQLFGAMHADERYGRPKIVVHEDVTMRDEQLADWSAGLITQRRHRR